MDGGGAAHGDAEAEDRAVDVARAAEGDVALGGVDGSVQRRAAADAEAAGRVVEHVGAHHDREVGGVAGAGGRAAAHRERAVAVNGGRAQEGEVPGDVDVVEV